MKLFYCYKDNLYTSETENMKVSINKSQMYKDISSIINYRALLQLNMKHTVMSLDIHVRRHTVAESLLDVQRMQHFLRASVLV